MKASAARELVQQYGAAQVIEKLRPLILDERWERITQVATARRDDVTVLLERFHDPHNCAAVLRSSEGFGLSAVHAIPGESGTQFSVEVSKGAQKWIDFEVHHDVQKAASVLQGQGYTLLGADAAGAAPEDYAHLEKVCLVMGTERAGLSPEMRRTVSGLVAIEMTGFVESFNVSVAAALLVNRTIRARQPVPCSGERLQHWIARYLVQTVREPEKVLRR